MALISCGTPVNIPRRRRSLVRSRKKRSAEAGAVDILADEALPYPIKASVEIGTTRAKLDGTVTGTAKLLRMDFSLDMSGDDLLALYPITGIVIFPSPPYRISGKLLYHDKQLSPADFAVAGGHIKSNLTINARGDIPTGEVRVDVKRLQLPKLFPKIELIHSAEGIIGGTTNLKVRGESVGALLGSANGHFGLVMSGGEISELVLGTIDLDAAVVLKALFAGDKNVPARCAVIDFDIKEGIMTSDAFVIDTKETKIVGEGQISLAEETIKMKLSPLPKEVSFPTLRTPVHIAGTFKDPIVYPDKVLAIRWQRPWHWGFSRPRSRP